MSVEWGQAEHLPVVMNLRAPTPDSSNPTFDL
jgi:hypothetical protein